MPAAGGGFGGNGFFETEVALRTRLDPRLDEGLAIRLLQSHKQRLSFAILCWHRLAIKITQQSRHAYSFAGAIQITPGPREHIKPRLLTPPHIKLRQIQRRLIERQHRHVFATQRGQYMRGIQGVVQQRIAVAVGTGFEDSFAARIQHLQVHPAQAVAGGKRCGMHKHFVLVSAHMQADVANAEKRGIKLTLERACFLHDREIQAGLLQLANALNGQIGQHALVACAAQHKAVHVHRLGQFGDRRAAIGIVRVVPRRIQLPIAALARTLIFGKELRQCGITHAQKFDIHFVHIHRHHRQAA